MASTSEVGHAKNVANFKLLLNNFAAIGAPYNPTNPQLQLTFLQNKYTSAFNIQKSVNDLLAPYTMAVDTREQLFKPLNKELTKLRKAYKATEGVTTVELDNLMTIIRKLKGEKKSKPKSQAETPDEAETHSTSQLSYDQRTNTLDALISLLQNTPNYNPNEPEYQVATYQAKKEAMLEATQKVAETFIPLNTARSERNKELYLADDNLVDIAIKAKDYAATILDTNSAQYKAIAKIKFRKR